jgi:hypothetical protein
MSLSAVTNGNRLLPGIDGRSKSARRYRDLIRAYAGDLGGEANLTEIQRSAVRQAAALTVQSESMQAQIIRGEMVDADQLVRVSNLLARMLKSMGVAKGGKTPPKRTLKDIIEARKLTP